MFVPAISFDYLIFLEQRSETQIALERAEITILSTLCDRRYRLSII